MNRIDRLFAILLTLQHKRRVRAQDLAHQFEIRSESKQTQNLVIDYIIHHVKANGKRSPKVFKLTKKRLGPGETVRISKQHSFRQITTRKYYAGQHALEIQVNGVIYERTSFELS